MKNYADLGITEQDVSKSEYYLVDDHPVKFVELNDGRSAAFMYNVEDKEFKLANHYLSKLFTSHSDSYVLKVDVKLFNARIHELDGGWNTEERKKS